MTDNEAASNKVAVKPASKWPKYEESHAQAEIVALRMLVAGATDRSVRQRTNLSWAHIHRLAVLVAEEASDPVAPRNVMRNPRPLRPARIRVVTPRQETSPDPAAPEAPPASQDTRKQPSETQVPTSAASPTEPEQLSLLCA
ncbi:hypothetical protein [Streptomyces noursei]|uniref:hypothetical protein n=1 Tax=Streptomyces noursei TaxID=1971 RepID=UPI00167B00C6|nr:hypothetical protein [Streptomyces noursei]MCZ1021234.1 hypothetical protein [Streptomyces noursei]GGX53126.1 hypothetical protein GCM10010341_88030 [Streptomyces noursei]